jgi:acyl CoA:acetate/3-ketoacid CoA transferase beta subunit
MDVTPQGLRVVELAPGVTPELIASKSSVNLIF